MTASRRIKPRIIFINAQNERPGGTDIPDSTGAAASQAWLLNYGELGPGATIITCMLLRLDALITTATSPGYASLFERWPGDRSKGKPLETAPCQLAPAEESQLARNIIHITVVVLPLVDNILQSFGIGLNQF